MKPNAKYVEYPLSKLANGIKVITSPYPCHFAGVGAYIKAGSRFEDENLIGMSHLCDRLSFKATKKFTQEEMEQKLLALGGNYQCESSRETMIYQASTFTKDIEQMAELISSTVTEPLLLPEEVAEQVLATEYEIESVNTNPETLLPELAHQAAFSDGLGNPLLIPKEKLLLVTPALLWQYRHAMYRPENLTLSFIGIPHDRSLEIASKYFGDFKATANVPQITQKRSTYVAGEKCVPLPPQIGNLPQFYHCHILFRGLGINDKDVYACATLQTLLGGGGSFSAGGPGKGMYSRLYTQVLNQYGYIESCLGVNHTYSDDGLFGISCSAVPAAAKYIPYVICSQLASLFTPNAISAIEVERAKNQLRSQLLMNLESRVVEMEDSGRQIEMNGKKMDVQDMVSRIDQLTVKDLQRVAQKILTGSNPTVVMMGDRAAFGDVRKVCKEFGLGLKG
ncbi:mitochondrial-processing protease subunit alpha [Starmerella bacillaris]|uniref:Alpha-MPP n=1 Tax=Starmerella bacillaris TaxID=1247836 RepID=A0AAV5RD16_STABA|nr:mitochondrial-processing protease subunit alpha [Starmerella bacillaris]